MTWPNCVPSVLVKVVGPDKGVNLYRTSRVVVEPSAIKLKTEVASGTENGEFQAGHIPPVPTLLHEACREMSC